MASRQAHNLEIPGPTPGPATIFELIAARTAHNPIPSRELERMLNTGGPAVRDAVRALRRAGEPIIAGERGYYLATRPEEVQIVIRDLQSRIASMAETVRALKLRAYERFQGQVTFDYFDQAGTPKSPGARILQAPPGRTGAAPEDGPGPRAGGDLFPVQMDRAEKELGYLSRRIAEGASPVVLFEELIGTKEKK